MRIKRVDDQSKKRKTRLVDEDPEYIGEDQGSSDSTMREIDAHTTSEEVSQHWRR